MPFRSAPLLVSLLTLVAASCSQPPAATLVATALVAASRPSSSHAATKTAAVKPQPRPKSDAALVCPIEPAPLSRTAKEDLFRRFTASQETRVENGVEQASQ